MGATSWNKILHISSGPQCPGPCILHREMLSSAPAISLTPTVFTQGPCRRHMEASLQELKASPRMVPRAVYLPNCDRKGFYKRKQVCPVPCTQVQRAPESSICQKTFSSQCLQFLSLTIVFPEPPISTRVPPLRTFPTPSYTVVCFCFSDPPH